jgi:hypothetical protein
MALEVPGDRETHRLDQCADAAVAQQDPIGENFEESLMKLFPDWRG